MSKWAVKCVNGLHREGARLLHFSEVLLLSQCGAEELDLLLHNGVGSPEIDSPVQLIEGAIYSPRDSTTPEPYRWKQRSDEPPQLRRSRGPIANHPTP